MYSSTTSFPSHSEVQIVRIMQDAIGQFHVDSSYSLGV